MAQRFEVIALDMLGTGFYEKPVHYDDAVPVHDHADMHDAARSP